jgi:D-glycero-beta-D-manno-heptose-7-phosphate kinase
MTMTLSRERLVGLLDEARGKRIVVIGDAMLDVYLRGEVDRISPEAPVPVVRVGERTYALGGAANVAQNVVAIGARCDLVAVVGADAGGRRIREMLRRLGASDEHLFEDGRCTTQKTRVIARSQQLIRFDEEDDSEVGETTVSHLLEIVGDTIATADALVLEDYNKGVLVPRVIRAAIGAAREQCIPIVVDPKYANFFEYGGATVFKPNRRELEAALGASVRADDPRALAAALRRLDVEQLLLTLGERGMMLISAAGAVVEVPTVARQVYDVVGAGDTVTAFLAAMLAAGGGIEESSVVANLAAGIEVGKLGAATVTPEELLAYADEHSLHAPVAGVVPS